MLGSLTSRESQRGDNHGSLVLEGSENNLSRKREASPGMGLSPGTLAEVSESVGGQKRRHTSHSGLACRQSARPHSEDSGMLSTFIEPSSPPGRNLLQVTYGTPTYCNAQPAWGASVGLGAQPPQVSGSPWGHWSSGVSAEADCFAFQYGNMDVETPDDTWLDIQTDFFTQPTSAPGAQSGTPPLLPSPSLPIAPAPAPALVPQQHAITAAESHQAFAQRQSNCLALKRSSQIVGPISGGRDNAVKQQQEQQQQQQGRVTTVDSRLSFDSGLQGSLGWQGPLRPGSCFFSTGSAPYRRGGTRIQAPTPTPTPTATPTPNPDLHSSVYQFQGSSSTVGVHVSRTSQVRGTPGGVGGHPPMGITAPGSSPALTPVAQPCRDGAGPGSAPQPPHLQQQHILTQMRLCMTHAQKLQQLLDTGRSMLGEALTEEERRRYQKQCNAVLAQHKILKAQYHLVCGGRAPAQGTPQGQGGLSGSPRAPAGALVAVGWNARLGYNGSGTFGNAAAVDDDYDRDLQAALAASVADQPGSQAACAVKPGTKGPAMTCPPRAVPRDTLAAREAAQLEEITRRTAEPLMVRAHNGGGVVWQNEKDHSVPKGEPHIPPIPQAYVPPSGDVVSPEVAANPETKSVPPAAAALPTAASPAADSPLAASDSCAEKVAELSLEENPAGLRLAKQVMEQEEDLSLLKALSTKELQAYGPQSESGYTSGDLCEDVDELDISDGINEGSEGAVSDTCSEEQEDFQAGRLAADEEAVSKAAQDVQLQDDWVFAEAEDFE